LSVLLGAGSVSHRSL